MTAKKKGQRRRRPSSVKRTGSWVTITSRKQYEKLAPYIREIETGAKQGARVKLCPPRDRARVRLLQRQLRGWLKSRGWLKPDE